MKCWCSTCGKDTPAGITECDPCAQFWLEARDIAMDVVDQAEDFDWAKLDAMLESARVNQIRPIAIKGKSFYSVSPINLREKAARDYEAWQAQRLEEEENNILAGRAAAIAEPAPVAPVIRALDVMRGPNALMAVPVEPEEEPKPKKIGQRAARRAAEMRMKAKKLVG